MPSAQALNANTMTTNSPVSNTGGKVFAENYSKIYVPYLSRVDRKAIRVLLLIYYYYSVVDYRTNHKLLRADAKNFCRGLSNFDLDTALTLADWSSGYTNYIGAGAGGTSVQAADIPYLLSQANDLKAMPEEDLDKMVAYFRINLGV